MQKGGRDMIRTAKEVKAAVADVFCITVSDLEGRGRTYDLTTARHVACHLMQHYSHLSLQQIGGELGGRDHTTVINSLRRYREVERRGDIGRMIQDVRKRLDVDVVFKSARARLKGVDGSRDVA